MILNSQMPVCFIDEPLCRHGPYFYRHNPFAGVNGYFHFSNHTKTIEINIIENYALSPCISYLVHMYVITMANKVYLISIEITIFERVCFLYTWHQF